MSLTIYGLKNCDSCRKALKTLSAEGLCVRFIDIRMEADLDTKLPDWLSRIGPDSLINKRSTSWRTLSQTEREEPPLQLLKSHATVIKRPIIERDDQIYVGWSDAIHAALL